MGSPRRLVKRAGVLSLRERLLPGVDRPVQHSRMAPLGRRWSACWGRVNKAIRTIGLPKSWARFIPPMKEDSTT